MLSWVLRTDLALTGTKYGCGEGICDACTVVVNGPGTGPASPLNQSDHRVAFEEGQLHPLQQAFIDHSAFESRDNARSQSPVLTRDDLLALLQFRNVK
jgi:aerobic-type carbon monoxide dehydrogenase small subunit (CoxS/CutS family)